MQIVLNPEGLADLKAHHCRHGQQLLFEYPRLVLVRAHVDENPLFKRDCLKKVCVSHFISPLGHLQALVVAEMNLDALEQPSRHLHNFVWEVDFPRAHHLVALFDLLHELADLGVAHGWVEVGDGIVLLGEHYVCPER